MVNRQEEEPDEKGDYKWHIGVGLDNDNLINAERAALHTRNRPSHEIAIPGMAGVFQCDGAGVGRFGSRNRFQIVMEEAAASD